MKAIFITRKGGPEVLELLEVARPIPAAEEVLVRVKAAGLNRSDIYSRSSKEYGPEDSPIPGLEVAGIVVECGSGVQRWQGETPFAPW